MNIPLDNSFCINTVQRLIYTIFNIQLDCKYCDNFCNCYDKFETITIEQGYDYDMDKHIRAEHTEIYG